MKINEQPPKNMNSHLQKVKTYLSGGSSKNQIFSHQQLYDVLAPACKYQETISPEILLLELVKRKYFTFTSDYEVIYSQKCCQKRTTQNYQNLLNEINSELKQALLEGYYFKTMLCKVEYFLIASRKLPK